MLYADEEWDCLPVACLAVAWVNLQVGCLITVQHQQD
jgi:hypothetical protein